MGLRRGVTPPVLSDRENEIALALVATSDPTKYNDPEVHALIWKVRDLLRQSAAPRLRGRR